MVWFSSVWFQRKETEPGPLLISALIVVPLSFWVPLFDRTDLMGIHPFSRRRPINPPVGTDLPLVADLCRARVVLLELLAD